MMAGVIKSYFYFLGKWLSGIQYQWYDIDTAIVIFAVVVGHDKTLHVQYVIRHFFYKQKV